MTRAPESLIWCSSSRSVYSGLFPTATAPIRWQAKNAITYSGQLGRIMPTRSPCFTPRPARTAENRSTSLRSVA